MEKTGTPALLTEIQENIRTLNKQFSALRPQEESPPEWKQQAQQLKETFLLQLESIAYPGENIEKYPPVKLNTLNRQLRKIREALALLTQ